MHLILVNLFWTKWLFRNSKSKNERCRESEFDEGQKSSSSKSQSQKSQHNWKPIILSIEKSLFLLKRQKRMEIFFHQR